MRRSCSILFFIFFVLLYVSAQSNPPKLVVGIVVDQMRSDYLYRFGAQYSENGFKRLMNNGFNCRYTHINYVPTYTGPGHTSIYAGTTPKYHGIVGNYWYNRKQKKTIYCVADSTEHIVGADSSKRGVSARNLLATNISDELKISTNQKAKVIAVSLKDRAASLPAGHMADGAFWLDLNSGNFVSSTFYMKKLPEWVVNFNHQKKAYTYLNTTWDLLLPENSYGLSIADDNKYEEAYNGKERPTFPYHLKQLADKNPPYFEMLYTTPFGNSLLADFAIETIKQSRIGKGAFTDLLAISFSSTDAAGHRFGSMSKEINDIYVRLDRDIARVLDALDQNIGKGNYVVFLTADHGGDDVPNYLLDLNVPAGYLDFKKIANLSAHFLDHLLGEGKWIESISNEQIYLNRNLIYEKGKDLIFVQDQLAGFLRDQEGVAQVYTANQLNLQEYTQTISLKVQNGFYHKRCGDIKLVLEPGWTDDIESAGSHGTAYTYDTLIPLLWYGAGIKKGESFKAYHITDIAPTISMMLKIKLPSACIGTPIMEVLDIRH